MAAKNTFQILVYHRLGKENSLDGLTVSQKVFESQMGCLRRQHVPLPLGDLVRALLHRKPIPRNAIAVTFDDGYADTFNLALPILRRFKIPATVFVTTGFVDQSVSSFQRAPMMTWAMIKKMQKAGMEIGSHTLTHPNLAQCSFRQARRELMESKKRLERDLGKKVELLAYPYGGARSFNGKIQKLAEEAGYLGACTTLPGNNGPKSDRYALRRLPPIKDEVYHLVSQLDFVMQKKPLIGGAAVRGVNAKAARIWARQYKFIKQHLANKNEGVWPNKRFFGS